MLSMILAAALAATAPDCDLERPSGLAGCTRRVVDALPMNALQAVGTHNSYKMAIVPNEMAMLKLLSPKAAETLDYSHPPLAEQLTAGARQLEIDMVYDPRGGLYATPLAYRVAGAAAVPYDFTALASPGLKVIHAPDVDYRVVCPTFRACLQEVRGWSRAHPQHVPILILLNLKEDGISRPGAVKPPLFDAQAMDLIDSDIRAVFPERALITPDKVQGRHASLREAAAAGAWPKLGAARGKVMIALDCPPDQVARYRGERRVLEGRAAFVNIEETSPAAGYITLNEPEELSARITAAVRAGLIVRTRADADTYEARANDTRRQVAAFASGAQYVSTDYMTPDRRFGPYVTKLPSGGTARVTPVREP